MASKPIRNASRSKRNAVNGWLVLNKPIGLTSTAALNKVKRMFNARKAGHAGTLDPLATGVLPIAFGEATKTVPYAVDSQKSYRFTVCWGAETATDDSEGEVVEESDKRPAREEIEAELDAFRGEIEQTPPRFSAVKIDGARAYDLAREGEAFEIESRIVEVDRLEIVEVPDADSCVFEADCGRGTYVRAIARDLGRALGCLGHICGLERTRVGAFRVDEAVTLEEIEAASAEDAEPGALNALLAPVHTALTDMPEIRLSSSDAARLRRGQPVLLRGRDAPILNAKAYATLRGTLVALGEVAQGEFTPERVFNLPVP
ncbi:MAG: tRNA pseudouridine(55) synthase TruB [Dichotomicrobium sp.]